jgi:hypothetical protein
VRWVTCALHTCSVWSAEAPSKPFSFDPLASSTNHCRKLAFIEQPDKKDKIAFYAVLDAFIGKKKLKDALSNVLSDVK